MRLLWTALGCLAVAIGLVGAVLPLLPTVPFMLLAAFCFARGSSRFHRWLTTHPRFGPPIEDWQRHGAISRRSKRLAALAILAALGMSLALGVRSTILMTQGVVMAGVLLFIFTRPDGPRS